MKHSQPRRLRRGLLIALVVAGLGVAPSVAVAQSMISGRHAVSDVDEAQVSEQDDSAAGQVDTAEVEQSDVGEQNQMGTQGEDQVGQHED